MKRITESDEAFIKANYTVLSDNEIGQRLGLGKATIKSYRKRENLKLTQDEIVRRRTISLPNRTTSTPEVDRMLTKEYLTVNVNQLSIKIGRSEMFVNTRLRQLGLIIPKEIIEQRKIASRIAKGAVPPNKGKKQHEFMTTEAIERCKVSRFKSGHLPHNTKAGDGVVTLRTDNRGIKQYHIRIELGKWEYLSRYLWRIHKGEIPSGGVVIYKDGNPLHCHISNLACISKKDNANRNANHDNPSNNRVATYLATSSRKVDKDLREQLLNHPELIQAKRQQLIYKRLIKNERRNNSQTGTAGE